MTFKRKRQLGFNLLTLNEGQQAFVEVTDHGHFETKDGESIEYWDLTNLYTGESQRMWVDGGIRGAVSQIGSPKDCVGMKFEIKKNPKVSAMVEIDGKLQATMVNNYSIWELT